MEYQDQVNAALERVRLIGDEIDDAIDAIRTDEIEPDVDDLLALLDK